MPTVANPYKLAFSPDGSLIVEGDFSGAADIHAWRRGELVRSVGGLAPPNLPERLHVTNEGELWARDSIGGVWYSGPGTKAWKRLLGGVLPKPSHFTFGARSPRRRARRCRGSRDDQLEL